MPTLFDAALYATERRAIVFVDAGFVLQIMQAHHEVSARSALAIDHPKLVEQLTRRVEETLGCPVLRIYWYDAVHPSGKLPNMVAAAMTRVDGVRVRLGTLHQRPDGRWEQKAVDTLLVRDMIAHAFKKTASEMVLVSGDNDLAPGVEEAQEQGVRVHLWSIRGDDLPPSVGRDLANLADSRLELEAHDLADAIRAMEAPIEGHQALAVGSVSPTAESRPVSPLLLAQRAPQARRAEPLAASEASGTTTYPEHERTEHPAAGAPRPVVKVAVGLGSQSAAVFSTGEDAFPRLYDLDREAYNAPVPVNEAGEIGTEYAHRWAAAAGGESLRRLQGRYDETFFGNIPRPIDADLLYFGGDHGLDTYATPLKFALRKGFWLGIAGAGSPPALPL